MIEGLWAGLGVLAIGALVTLLFVVNAIDKEARTRAMVVLVVGGLATLVTARVVGGAVWKLLDPGSLG